MTIEKVKIGEIKNNPNNPRTIKDENFKKLVKSIEEFPQMLDIRPIVVDDDMVVLGGNMRLKACKDAGLKEVSVIKASTLSESQKSEFIIKDNVGYGEWDFDMLNSEWDTDLLSHWGLDVPEMAVEIDYSILNEDEGSDTDDELEKMEGYVKKGILIEFNGEDYEVAFDLIKKLRDKKVYFGSEIVKTLEKLLEG